jgi:hypothetical protein
MTYVQLEAFSSKMDLRVGRLISFVIAVSPSLLRLLGERRGIQCTVDAV